MLESRNFIRHSPQHASFSLYTDNSPDITGPTSFLIHSSIVAVGFSNGEILIYRLEVPVPESSTTLRSKVHQDYVSNLKLIQSSEANVLSLISSGRDGRISWIVLDLSEGGIQIKTIRNSIISTVPGARIEKVG
jgi:hypothetical protein